LAADLRISSDAARIVVAGARDEAGTELAVSQLAYLLKTLPTVARGRRLRSAWAAEQTDPARTSEGVEAQRNKTHGDEARQ
jgi:hypothetical protein